ncbi:sugar transferase [Pseudoroseicyclus sp. CXY001]|uniref:sugar transferase n=1 Tax=Pseudoroseicyclus sp. CXY001 TaxID=3242492 RepID=UPI003570D6AF
MTDNSLTEEMPRHGTEGRRGRRSRLYGRRFKRPTDLILAIVIMPIVAPMIGILWLLARRDGGRGFFGHRRIGRDGKPFICWKIRTMVPDASERLARHLAENPEAAAEWAAGYKLHNDPRVTTLGAVLRRTSLDELPQLWNVLRGDMSFVGPRPVPEVELALYGVSRGLYESVRPGITGLWQITGRNGTTYAERIALDRAYISRISLRGDLAILFRTARAVISPTGL